MTLIKEVFSWFTVGMLIYVVVFPFVIHFFASKFFSTLLQHMFGSGLVYLFVLVLLPAFFDDLIAVTGLDPQLAHKFYYFLKGLFGESFVRGMMFGVIPGFLYSFLGPYFVVPIVKEYYYGGI